MLSNFCVIAIASSFLLKDLLEIGSHLYINNICLKKYILATSENFQYDPYTDTGPEGIVVDGVKILGTHWDTIRNPKILIGNPASSRFYTGTYFLNTSYKVWTWALANDASSSYYRLEWLDLGSATTDDYGCESWFTGRYDTSDLAPCATYDIPKVD